MTNSPDVDGGQFASSRRPPRPRRRLLALPDVLDEALAGLLQRPGRSCLTALGTLLATAAFVAVVNITLTTRSQVEDIFASTLATEFVIRDDVSDPLLAGPAFPGDAEERLAKINGVVGGGVFWQAAEAPVRLATSLLEPERYAVIAAGPGWLSATDPRLAEGRLFDEGHNQRSDRVAVVGFSVASRLQLPPLVQAPSIDIEGIKFTVIGIVDDVRRRPETLLSVVVPEATARSVFGPAPAGAQMLVTTATGAAGAVAEQAPLAVRPDDPERLTVVLAGDPRELEGAVDTSLSALLLVLAGVCLAAGAAGIANTTLLSVLERVPEIGLRRALGAPGKSIAGLFLTESATLGALGGATGTVFGVGGTLLYAAAQQAPPVVAPWTVLVGPLAGGVTGVLAGLYPAIKATRVQPVQALSR